ncbi:hypothetical protein GCM10025298_04070 [Natronobiforma cellulositropha]
MVLRERALTEGADTGGLVGTVRTGDVRHHVWIEKLLEYNTTAKYFSVVGSGIISLERRTTARECAPPVDWARSSVPDAPRLASRAGTSHVTMGSKFEIVFRYS